MCNERFAPVARVMSRNGGPCGGEVADIACSASISSGSVTGFGSIFVNSVEFETDIAVFEIEEISGSQTGLVSGMCIVSGTNNADSIGLGVAGLTIFNDSIVAVTRVKDKDFADGMVDEFELKQP